MIDDFEWLPGDQVEWGLSTREPSHRGEVVADQDAQGAIVKEFFADRTRVRVSAGHELLVKTSNLRFAVPPGTYEAICAAICAGPECASDLPHRPFWHLHQAHRLVAAMARLGAIQHHTEETVR
jgi:hypothetical protein